MDFEIVPCNDQAYLSAAIQLAAEHDISLYNPALDAPEDGYLGWEHARQLVKHFVKPEGSYIALVNGEAVGVASGGADESELRYGYLHFLYVKPNYRGRGIGTALLQKLEQYFAEKECRRIKICVSPGDETALPFLGKRGYYQDYIAMKKRVPQREKDNTNQEEIEFE